MRHDVYERAVLDREKLVKQAKEAFLATDYSPWNPDNMAEFMQEIEHGWIVRLADLCKHGKTEEVGLLFRDFAEQYWTELAESKAEREVASAYDLAEDAAAEALDARMDAAKDARMGL